MGNKQWFNNNFFLYGETNNRLNGIRDSEVYNLSADKLENFYISEIGSLRSAKKFETTKAEFVSIPQREILDVFDTPNAYYIVLTLGYLQTRRYADDVVIDEVGIPISGDNKASYFNDTVLISKGTGEIKSYSLDSVGVISETNFSDTIVFPIKDRFPFEFNLYKCYSDGAGGYKAVLMSTFSEQEITINGTTNAGGIFIGDNQVNRIYTVYSEFPEFFMDASTEGQLFMVIKNFDSMTLNRETYIGNDKLDIAFGSEFDPVYDAPFAEYAEVNGAIPTSDIVGVVRAGNIDKTLLDSVVSTKVFQNRLFMITDEVIYASATFDYNNFLNGIDSTDAFFIKPSPPNQQQPKLYNMISGNGLYIASSQGVYVFGYDSTLTPSTSLGALRIASYDPVKEDSDIVLIGNDMYYFTEDNVLKCIQPTYTTGQLTFWNSITEKFDESFNKRDGDGLYYYKSLTKANINDKERLVVGYFSSKEGVGNKLYIYDRMDYNVFRRYTVIPDLSSVAWIIGIPDVFTVKSVRDKLIFYGRRETGTASDYYSLFQTKSNINYQTLTLKLHTPNLKTNFGGSYLNDYHSQLKKICINLLNENTDSIESVSINGRDVQLLTTTDLFSLYKSDVSYRMYDGITIEIVTKENTGLIEVKGIDMLIDINGDR